MSSCPDLGALEEAPLPPVVSSHVARCPACRLVVDVFSTELSDASVCVRFDALLAARAEGTLNTAGKNLLDRHLASCADCREVAETLSPIADQGGDHATLPRVDPGAYELGLEVGRGGMGRVLAARDLRVGRPVAVKELLGRAPQLAARFEREARVTARLQHPGIVPIYEIGQWPDGTPFYSMRMVEGRKLIDAIESAQTLADRLALLPSVIAAAEAVAFAHSQRVIHRDLTPSNILVGAYGETVVIDWGLAKDLTEGAPSDDDGPDHPAEGSGDKLTGVGAIIGTAAYMPPEQAHAIPVDERADVYALGAILYHVLAGSAPYRAKSTRELLRDVRTGPPRPIGELELEAPRDLISIVEKAMAREPEARYPSARELTEELKRFQTGRIVEAHDYSSTERLLRFLKKHKAVVSVAAFALVLLGVMSAVAVSRVLRSRTEARDQVRELLVERGRVELLAGSHSRALAYLDEAAKQGTTSPALTFLRAAAFVGVPESVRVLDCGGDVRFAQYSPDGKRMVGACLDRARVWDAATGEVLVSLPRAGTRPNSFNRVVFSHDGTKLLSWGDAGDAHLWSASTGEELAVLAHGRGVNVAEFSPDDRRVVTFGQDGTAQVWTTGTGQRERTIVAKETGVLYLFGAISRDGTQVLTVSMEGEGRGWNIETGEKIGGFDHGGRALLIGGDYSRDGKYSATCGTDRLAKVWDMQRRTAAVILGGHTDVIWKCVFSDDGTRLLTSGHDGRVMIWDLATGAAIASVLHGDIVPWGRFSPDGRRFLTVGVDGLVKLWDARSGAMLVSLDSVGGKDAHFSPDGTHLVAQRGDGRIQIWKTPDPRPTLSPAPGARIELVSSDGRRAAISSGGTVALHDTVTGARLAHAEIHAPIAISETRLAGTTESGVALIELTSGASKSLALTRPETLELSGSLLAVTFGSRAPQIWNADTGSVLAEISGARYVKLGNAGHLLAWGPGSRPFVRTVDDSAHVELQSESAFDVIGFSHDDRRVVLSEPRPDKTHRLTIWDTATGTQIGEPITDTSVGATLDPGSTNVTSINAASVVTVTSLADGRALTSFVLDQLLQAQSNTAGTLIAGLGDNGTSILVMSADGRILLRLPIEHASPTVLPTGFRAAEGMVRWSRNEDTILARSSILQITPVTRGAETRLDVPYRVVGGRLVEIEKVRVRGTVTAAGQPVRNAMVTLELRTTAQRRSGADYESRTMHSRPITATTDGNGAFQLPEMVGPADSTLTVKTAAGETTVSVRVGIDDAPLSIEVPR